MCGRPLVETRPEPPAGRSEPVPARDLEPTTPAPAYTGGLFNLGAPADKPHRDLDYLLEDDEDKGSNKGLILLTLIALILVVGLGWLRWRNGGLPFLKSLTSSSQPKPPASQGSTPTDSSAPTPNAQNPSAATGSPAPDSSSQTSTPPAESSITPITPANPAGSPATPSESAADPNSAAPVTAPPASSASHEASKEETPEKSAPSEAEAAAPAPPVAAKPKPVAKPAPKPAAKVTDPVVVGERYLYGKEGFPQNCERGLHYVKPAADQSNPKAMITMGALYATGHCLSKDLPTAYRYFALALRGDPENGPLRQNAEMVWKQMTAEERKQAIRLTQ
jgi:hypothetical protein